MKSLDYKFDFRDKRNPGLVMDFCELTMSQCYFNSDHEDHVIILDLFYCRNPDSDGCMVLAGLEEIIGHTQNLHFEDSDTAYLRSLNHFNDESLEHLRRFIFIGGISVVKEGTPMFPCEPLTCVKARTIETQLLETAVLLCVNHQTLVATKVERTVKAAQDGVIAEFGARRAHNFDAANYGIRAVFIGGVAGTATTYTGQKFGMPVLETMVHSFVQSFDRKYDAFLAYAKTYPDNCTMLPSIYNTLKNGLVDAIRVMEEYPEPNGYRPQGVRIGSRDIAYLSKEIRMALDAAGTEDCNIVTSNSLDEYLIQSLISQGAQINSMGVGENPACSKSAPIFSGMYKMSPAFDGDTMILEIKVSENAEKVTNPGYGDLYRIYDKEGGKAAGDLMTIHEESLDPSRSLTIYHQMNSWENETIPGGSYVLRDLLGPISLNGELVYEVPGLQEIRACSEREFSYTWDEILRFEYPQIYHVGLSKQLLDLKLKILEDIKRAG